MGSGTTYLFYDLRQAVYIPQKVGQNILCKFVQVMQSRHPGQETQNDVHFTRDQRI